MKYQDYLKSALWQRIRRRVLKRDKRRCQSCGRRAWQVHHGSYDPDTMAGRRLDRLHSLCGRCHREISFDRWGVAKRPFPEQVELSRWLGQAKPSKPEKRPRRKRPKPERSLSSDPRIRIVQIRDLSRRYAEGEFK